MGTPIEDEERPPPAGPRCCKEFSCHVSPHWTPTLRRLSSWWDLDEVSGCLLGIVSGAQRLFSEEAARVCLRRVGFDVVQVTLGRQCAPCCLPAGLDVPTGTQSRVGAHGNLKRSGSPGVVWTALVIGVGLTPSLLMLVRALLPSEDALSDSA